MADLPYPSAWEADVVLSDGGTVHVRPILPEDAAALEAFHSRLSEQTIYYRFFGPYPRLMPRDLERFTHVDHHDRVALIAQLGNDMIGVGRYERLPDSDDAEVAFVIEDAHQGRGLGSVRLEHLTAIGREVGLTRFVADVLPDNRRMIRVFLDAGYAPERRFEADTVHFVFSIEETEKSLEVMHAREHRAEARSIARILAPASVAVVGVSQQPRGVGRTVLTNLLGYGFDGPVYPVNRRARHVASIRAYPSVADVPDDVDVAVLTVAAESVLDVVGDCARRGVRGLVVISAGFGEVDEEGMQRQRQLVDLARSHGMRVIGPNALGVINTDPQVRLNASLAPVAPGRGRIGFFSQSGALGIALLEEVAMRGIGLSTFVSAGNRADVSGNDLLQYWEEDPSTDVVLLYLESFGNARKFTRIARRISTRKPVVVGKTGRAVSGVPLGHRGVAVSLPDEAVDALFRQAGVIRVDTAAQMLDVAQVLGNQPLPAGRRVAVVGNSSALGVLAVDACVSNGLEVAWAGPVDLGPECTEEEFRAELRRALDDPDVDAVVTVFIPPVATTGEAMAQVLVETTQDADKPVLSTFLAFEGVPELLRRDRDGVPGRGSIPSYRTPEVAVAALARVADYAEWRRRPTAAVPELPDIEPEQAAAVVAEVLDESPQGRTLSRDEIDRLMAGYGIATWASRCVTSAEEAVAAAEELGWPVALKAREDWLRHRVDLGGVRLDIGGEAELRAAYEAVRGIGGRSTEVQAMAPPGVAVVVDTQEDPSFGVLVSVGVAGVSTELLGDRAYRAVPLTDADAREMVRSLHAAPLLFGWRGADPVDVAALEALLLRIARLADHLPEVKRISLNPVLVGREGLTVLDAVVEVAPAGQLADTGPRRMRSARAVPPAS